MTIESIFQTMAKDFNAEYAGELEARVQFVFEDKQWSVIISQGVLESKKGMIADPTLVVTTSTSVWIGIRLGSISGLLALMAGKVKLSGNVEHFKRLLDKKLFLQ